MGFAAKATKSKQLRRAFMPRAHFMSEILGGSGYFSHALRFPFELVVRFAIHSGGESEFPGRVLLLSKGLIDPGQLVVDRSILIGSYGDLVLLFRFAVIVELR